MGVVTRVAQSFLLGRHITLGKAASTDAIAEFLSTIRPVETEHPLIRVGGAADGGYLIPNDLEGIAACFSPGVATTADFEAGMAARGIRCFLADASVEAPPIEGPLLDFERKFLGTRVEGNVITLSDWVQRKAPGASDLLLQMDIEGAEYRVVLNTSPELLRRFRIMVIEFHHLASIYDRSGLDLASATFARILDDFEIVHIHPNNRIRPVAYKSFLTPPLLEFTFMRRDRITSRRPARQFPHPLDRTNFAKRPDFDLPSCWYRHLC